MANESSRHSIVVIGAGGAGLSISYHLRQFGLEHVVLERGQTGNTWQKERWDSFHLIDPSWSLRLHGFNYAGSDPDGFLSRDETVKMLEDYAASFSAPVRHNIEVTAIERHSPSGYLLRTQGEDLVAETVVVATGAFGVPAYPPSARSILENGSVAGITHIHSSAYRNAGELPPGGVLVIGSGQSGAQIMEDLFDAGREVSLSVSGVGRRPRRYRGRDSTWWHDEMGHFDRTVKDVKSIDVARFGSSAHVSGTKGGHDIHLKKFARVGVRMLGRFKSASGGVLRFEDNLQISLKRADDFAARWRAGVDAFVLKHGLDAPLEPNADPQDLAEFRVQDPPRELDLRSAGISTVIWATGFRYDYSWIRLPLTGERGYPVQKRGVTDWPGLYFCGLSFMYSAKSARFIGVSEDAQFVAEDIARKLAPTKPDPGGRS